MGKAGDVGCLDVSCYFITVTEMEKWKQKRAYPFYFFKLKAFNIRMWKMVPGVFFEYSAR
jgi:hypothetical protein